jgi:hypothetical protein
MSKRPKRSVNAPVGKLTKNIANIPQPIARATALGEAPSLTNSKGIAPSGRFMAISSKIAAPTSNAYGRIVLRA